jgi:hypothetical protein
MKKKMRLYIIAAVLFCVIILVFILFKRNHHNSSGSSNDRSGISWYLTSSINEETKALPFLQVVPVIVKVDKYLEIPVGEGEVFNPQVSPDGSRLVFLKK